MKRIISLLISLSVMLSAFVCVNVNAETVQALSEKQTALLETVGVINEEYSLDHKLTRGEFAVMLAAIAFPELPVYSDDYENKNITDVDVYSDYYEEVLALYEFDYVDVDKFGRFFPENALTVKDAISMAIKTLGASEEFVSQVYGSELLLATRMKLTEGMDVLMNSSTVNVYSAYKLIYNMLYADISLIENQDNEVIYMEDRLSIYETRGLVNNDGIVSIDPGLEPINNYIEINGISYRNDSDYCDLFGQVVSAFYTIEESDVPVRVLLSVCESEYKGSVTTLLSKNIKNYQNRTYYYYEDAFQNKVNEISVPRDARIIYNDREVKFGESFLDSMFKPENGRIRLYSVDDDNAIEIVRIEDFSVGVVNSVDLVGKKIFIKNQPNATIYLANKEYLIEDENGVKVELEEVKKNNTLLFGQSLNGKFVKILLSTDVETDEVVSRISKGHGVLTTASGGTYELTKKVADMNIPLEMGKVYTFYFDAFDMVALYEEDKESQDAIFGYLAAIAPSTESLNPAATRAAIYSQYDKLEKYYFNKKVKVIEADDTINYYEAKDMPTVTYRGVVRYNVNSNNVITSIEIPHTFGSKPTKENRLFYLLDTYANESASDYYIRAYTSNVNCGGAAIIDGNSPIFYAPEPSNAMAYDEYKMGSLSNFSTTETGPAMCVFGTDYRLKTAACVSIYSTYSATITSEYPYVVTDVCKTTDPKNGDIVYQLSVKLVQGTEAEKTFYMEKNVYETQVFPIANGDTTAKQLAKGDWIYYTAQGEYIRNAILAFDLDQTVLDERGNTITGAIAGTRYSYYNTADTLSNPFAKESTPLEPSAGASDAWKYNPGKWRLFTGWLYSVENGIFQLTNQNPAYGYDPSKTYTNGAVNQVFVFTSGRGTCLEPTDRGFVNIRTMADSDMKSYLEYGADCSRVVFAQTLYDPRGIMLINY